jgi:hypothetical protein
MKFDESGRNGIWSIISNGEEKFDNFSMTRASRGFSYGNKYEMEERYHILYLIGNKLTIRRN